MTKPLTQAIVASAPLTIGPARHGAIVVGAAALNELGTARMGSSPETSVIDLNSECWDAPGVCVIDGAAMQEQGFLNPALTTMALAARAVDHVLKASSAPRGATV